MGVGCKIQHNLSIHFPLRLLLEINHGLSSKLTWVSLTPLQLFKSLMERDPLRSNNSYGTANNKVDTSGRSGGGGAEASLLLRSSCDATKQTAPSYFVLQWGNRKRLRCMKVQGSRDKTDPAAPAHRTTARVDRRVVRADKDSPNRTSITHSPANHSNISNGYLNLRQRASSPQLPPPPHQRILRYLLLPPFV